MHRIFRTLLLLLPLTLTYCVKDSDMGVTSGVVHDASQCPTKEDFAGIDGSQFKNIRQAYNGILVSTDNNSNHDLLIDGDEHTLPSDEDKGNEAVFYRGGCYAHGLQINFAAHGEERSVALQKTAEGYIETKAVNGKVTSTSTHPRRLKTTTKGE